MSFLYAMIFGGVICALTQLLAEFKLPFPAIAVIMMTLGGGILGFGGMLLGVPIAAACYRLLKEDVEKT